MADLQDSSSASTWREPLLVLLLLYAAALVILGPTVQFGQWYISPDNNQAAAEAVAWLDGRLDLPTRGGDIAAYDGRFYNVFPPLLTFICIAYYGLTRLVFGEMMAFFPWLFALIIAAPIPLLAWHAFRAAGTNVRWAAVFALYLVAGTALRPEAEMLAETRTAWIYSLQEILAQAGLALILIDLFGRRRFWPAGLGVLIAAWSRQTCLAYALPVLWLAWRDPRRGKAVAAAAIPICIAIGVQGGLNWLKFDSPLEDGYRFIFAPPQAPPASALGPDGTVRLFSLSNIPHHAYEMFLAPPRFDWTVHGLTLDGPATGTQTTVWFGTPLLLVVLLDARRWWANRHRRALMLATIPVILADLAYHGPIDGSPGYHRYTLDFVLIWLAVIAPYADSSSRRGWTLAALAYSVCYFYLIADA